MLVTSINKLNIFYKCNAALIVPMSTLCLRQNIKVMGHLHLQKNRRSPTISYPDLWCRALHSSSPCHRGLLLTLPPGSESQLQEEWIPWWHLPNLKWEIDFACYIHSSQGNVYNVHDGILINIFVSIKERFLLHFRLLFHTFFQLIIYSDVHSHTLRHIIMTTLLGTPSGNKKQRPPQGSR